MYRKMICLISIALFLGFARTLQAELVGHWTLDDGSGDTAVDSSGNGYDGTLMWFGNDPWVTGKIGGALEFDGTSYVDCTNDAGLDITGPFSATIWIRPGTEGYIENAPLSKASSTAGWSWQLRYGWDSYGYRPSILGWQFNADNGSRVWVWVDQELPVGEWYHIAAAYDGETVKCYLDGVETDSQPMTGFAGGASPFLIGSDGWRSDWIGAIDDVRLYDHGLSQAEVLHAMFPAVADVPLDAILTWAPGARAHTHNVYFGTNWDDVNNATVADSLDVLVSQGQDANSYDPPGIFDFGKTYYWRVDEVSGAPDYTIFKGAVWSFTAEPMSYPIASVSATASSSHSADRGPEKTIDGSGLNARDQHGVTATDMWQSGAGVTPAWIQYEFDKVYKLHEMWVWNSNQLIEFFLGLGAKDVLIETSSNGNDWAQLEDATQFAQGTAAPDYMHNTTVSLDNVLAKYVRITINAGYGMMPQYGLSEVRFFAIPTYARGPEPAAGAFTDGVDIVLSWRAGREAASHQVYLGMDAENLALLGNTTENTWAAGTLEYTQTYYWSVTEVNEAETPQSYAGDVWSFTTPGATQE